MDLVSAVKTVKEKAGVTKAFYGMLCDYGAFDEEERWAKGIVKQICDNGYVEKLSQSPSTTEIADMIYKMTSQYGYDRNNVSYIFHKLALGLSVVKPSFDWDKEFKPSSSKPSASRTPLSKPSSSDPSSNTSKSNFCPQCGAPYYKTYSTYCAMCGTKR
jgi:hypothetical protein